MAREEIARVKQLLRTPVLAYREAFSNVDGQTGEVLTALRNLPLAIEFVRKARDSLHAVTLVWEDIREEWEEIGPLSEKDELVD